jgi:hypothetical protein
MTNAAYLDGWAVKRTGGPIGAPPGYSKAYPTKKEAEDLLAKITNEKGYYYSVVRVREYYNRYMDPKTGLFTFSSFAEDRPGLNWAGIDEEAG